MSEIPAAVFVIWWIGLGVGFLVLVPLAVVMLHRTWRAARNIRVYTGDALRAAGGIAGNVEAVAALDETIGVASEMLPVAGGVRGRLETIADVLEDRAARR